MQNSKSIVSVLILLAVAIINVSAQAQTSRSTDRQVGVILQRLDRTSARFRNSLSTALVQQRIDQTRSGNDINTFRSEFEQSMVQLREQFNQRRAAASDVENVLRSASRVNGFMTRTPLNRRAQSDWAMVRTDLNSLANAYGIAWQWNQTVPAGSSKSTRGLSENELGQLIRRIDTGGEAFRTSLTEAFGESRYDQTRSEGTMNDHVRSFKNATDQLRNQFDSRQPVPAYVERLLARAAPIDTYMRNNRLTNRVQSDWSTLRGDLSQLANSYSLATNWQNTGEPPVTYNSDSRLTGTFRLDPSRSDKPADVAQRATRSLPNDQRQMASDRLRARLESPEILAIERRGSTVTLASSRARQQTFEADGVAHQETISNRPTQVTATLQGDQLIVSSTGYRQNDFNVTFESIENGSRLRVKRQIYLERLNQPVVVNSIYNRTSEVAQWNIFDNAQPVLGSTTGNNGDFIVRDGETILAVLNDGLTTEQSKQGDRFTMTVREPGEYEGAVIEGTVGTVDQGGRVTGRSGLSLNFDTIRLRNGQTHRFAGALTSVRMVNGDTVSVDNEGSAQGDNQTTQTVQRAGIGTAIGAIIGAIAGGGKGAVIGAVVGAAGGAGSVYVQGKDNLELPSGTELTIRASAPR
jgi:hypothetical protein